MADNPELNPNITPDNPYNTAQHIAKTRKAKLAALTGYWGLFILVPLWHIVLAPHPDISLGFLLTIWWLPLFLPMHGLIKGKPYTYAWVNFITLFYVLHSLTMIYAEPTERVLAIIEFLLACVFFTGACYYARWQGQYLGLGLKKNKDKTAR
ncbi:DUF2069 domain-containing protein [Saccharobesus litoralis]|uniref:DUF2069 domain-containing protein n=1 Tax=Saccharobesus litoralis TaxID=2172099 RepID=A0A2S0VLV1_9ALTE|nr:DUF2069 domain-containing protein [Saccharobesus litoralis]AWB65194.1 DUF2069 domain-containing protein [Saccharobesus litoralis]